MAKNKKDNINSFSGMFIGIEDLDGIDKEEVSRVKGELVTKGRPKVERETKKRISLAILPSLYESVGKIAYIDRVSISEIVSKRLEIYVEENLDKIMEYDKLKK